MQLDAVTLYFCATIVAACCALAMFHGWRVHRNEPAVRYGMIGFVCSALGTLPIALGSFLPIWLARGIGNTVAVASRAFRCGDAGCQGQRLQRDFRGRSCAPA